MTLLVANFVHTILQSDDMLQVPWLLPQNKFYSANSHASKHHLNGKNSDQWIINIIFQINKVLSSATYAIVFFRIHGELLSPLLATYNSVSAAIWITEHVAEVLIWGIYVPNSE